MKGSQPQKYVGPNVQGSREEYRLERRLQNGLFGGVYEATGLSSGSSYAVKVLHRIELAKAEKVSSLEFCEVPLSEKTFKKQMQDHENIMELEDHFEDEYCHYLVFKLARGGDLLEALKLRPEGFDEDEGRFLIRQATEALACLHERGLAMQDVSLENMLLHVQDDGKYQVKMCDPGQAVVVTVNQQTGQELPVDFNGYVGKSFRPPELLLREPYLATKVDSWCLGWSTYYLLAAQPLFLSADPAQQDADWLLFENGEAERLLHLKGTLLSEKCTDFILRLLQLDPAKRMSMLEALDHEWLKDGALRPMYAPKDLWPLEKVSAMPSLTNGTHELSAAPSTEPPPPPVRMEQGSSAVHSNGPGPAPRLGYVGPIAKSGAAPPGQAPPSWKVAPSRSESPSISRAGLMPSLLSPYRPSAATIQVRNGSPGAPAAPAGLVQVRGSPSRNRTPPRHSGGPPVSYASRESSIIRTDRSGVSMLHTKSVAAPPSVVTPRLLNPAGVELVRRTMEDRSHRAETNGCPISLEESSHRPPETSQHQEDATPGGLDPNSTEWRARKIPSQQRLSVESVAGAEGISAIFAAGGGGSSSSTFGAAGEGFSTAGGSARDRGLSNHQRGGQQTQFVSIARPSSGRTGSAHVRVDHSVEKRPSGASVFVGDAARQPSPAQRVPVLVRVGTHTRTLSPNNSQSPVRHGLLDPGRCAVSPPTQGHVATASIGQSGAAHVWSPPALGGPQTSTTPPPRTQYPAAEGGTIHLPKVMDYRPDEAQARQRGRSHTRTLSPPHNYPAPSYANPTMVAIRHSSPSFAPAQVEAYGAKFSWHPVPPSPPAPTRSISPAGNVYSYAAVNSVPKWSP